MKLDRATILAEGWLSAENLLKELNRRGVKLTQRTLRRYHELGLVPGLFGPPDDAKSKGKFRLYYPANAVQKVVKIRKKLERGYKLRELAQKEMTPDRALASLAEWRTKSGDAYQRFTKLLEKEQARTSLPLVEAWQVLMGTAPAITGRTGRQLYIGYD
jgi:DNA-binding transcriptional MerR regulator